MYNIGYAIIFGNNITKIIIKSVLKFVFFFYLGKYIKYIIYNL